jgi:hypothetical protein
MDPAHRRRQGEDLTGKRIGRLTVLRRTSAPFGQQSRGQVFWEVECQNPEVHANPIRFIKRSADLADDLKHGRRNQCRFCAAAQAALTKARKREAR